MTLRKEIFWAESMGDDKVVDAVFNVPHVYEESDWGMHETIIEVAAHGSYVWDPPIKGYQDADQLRFPEITVDHQTSEKLLSLARETFDGVLLVRQKTIWWWTLGMTWTLVNLHGLEQVMIDMCDHPEGLHRLMGILRDGHLAKLDFLQENGLLSLNGSLL